MTWTHRLFGLFASTVLFHALIARPVAADDAAVFSEWVRTKVPTAQRAIRDLDTASQNTTARIEERQLRDGKSFSCVLHIVEKYSGDNALRSVTQSNVQPTGADTHMRVFTFGKNSRYYFELSPPSRSKGWLLDQIVARASLANARSDQNRPMDQLPAEAPSIADDLLKCDFVGVKYLPEELETLPGLVLHSARVTPTGEAIDLHFSFTPVNVMHPKRADVTCQVRYDLTHGIPVETVLSSGPADNPGVRKKTIRLLRIDDAGCDHVIENSITSHRAGKLIYSSQNKCEVSSVFGSVPESEFTLAAFGIPEPPGFEPPPTPLYLWLLAAAGGFFALVIAFRVLARRQSVG